MRFAQPASARVGTPRLPPVSSPRAETARPMTSSAQVRGGGRLFIQSPLYGYSEPEMIREAQIRINHNRQRQRLKNLLITAADGGPVVKTRDLLLACQLAKVSVDTDSLHASPFAAGRRDNNGAPQGIAWKDFHKALEYPNLHGHGAFTNLPPTRRQRGLLARAPTTLLTPQASMESAVAEVPVDQPSDMEVYEHWVNLKRMMATRFTEMRRAFRLIDEDSSGTCDRGELKFMLNAMFNLSIPDRILDRIIDFADLDGDGQIDFAEFAGVMTAENILEMKAERDREASRQAQAAGKKGTEREKEVHAKLRRTGPGLENIRKAHKIYKKEILARYNTFREAFKAIDEDGSGLIRRAELRKFMRGLSKSINDRTISSLIDFCDLDGDAKTLNITEFVKMLQADELGGEHGYDPHRGKL